MRYKIPLLFLTIFSYHLFSAEVNETNLGNLIKENRKNMELIDVVLSNLTPPANKKEGTPDSPKLDKYDYSADYTKLHKANQLDYEGVSLYYKRNYKSAFGPLRKSQKFLVSLFTSTIDKHIKDTVNLVDYVHVKVIKIDDPSAKQFTQLATRQLKFSQDLKSRADNLPPHKFGDKLNLCKQALEASRQSRKLAILALLEYKTWEEDKKEYKKVTMDQAIKKEIVNPKEDYESIKHKLTVYIENKKLDRLVASPLIEGAEKVDLMEVHDDNFNIITYNRSSLIEKSNVTIRFEAVDVEKPPVDSSKPVEKAPENTNP